MAEQEVLGMIVGVIFIVLGSALLIRYKKLTKSKYYQLLFLIISLMVIGFGIYLIGHSIYIYG